MEAFNVLTLRKKFVLSLFVILITSCAYFNTFYNAKVYFHEAEKEYKEKGKLTPQARQNYNKVIEKCSKVIEFYPRSKYVDDALYLMGVSYYRMGEYDKAIRKFKELLRFYPDSKFVPKAKLMLARTYIKQGEYDLARSLLSDMPSEEAELLIIDSYIESEEFNAAAEAIDSFIVRHPKSKYLRELHLKAAKVYKELGRKDLTLYHISQFLKMRPTRDEIKQALELQGDLYLDLEMPDSALQAYSSIEFDSPNDTNYFRIRMKMAMAYEEKGEIEEAKSIYRELLGERRARSRAQEAGYRLGRILEESDSIEAAIEAYQKASRAPGTSEFKSKATKRLQALRKVSNIVDSTLMSDTTGEKTLSLAEAYLFDLDKPEKAAELYRSLYEQHKGEPMGAKALYALIIVNLNFIGDTTAASDWYHRLQMEYGDTIFAIEAKKYWGDLFGD